MRKRKDEVLMHLNTSNPHINKDYRRKTLLVSISLVMVFSLLISASLGVSANQSTAVPASQTEIDWQTEFVEMPEEFKNMTDRSLRVDGEGHAHIVFGGDQLNYTWYNGKEWNHTVVDNAPKVGQYAAVALDSDENPHISYYDETNGSLKYAYRNGTQWVIQTIDSGGDVGQYTSIDIHESDENGDLPRISYYDITNTNLKNAYFTGTQWVIETIDNAGDVGRFSSLALDKDGIPHVAYYDESSASELTLKYAYWDVKANNNAGGWVIDTVDPNFSERASIGIGSYASIAVRDNKVHIAYYDQGNMDLKYANGKVGNWDVETIDDGEHVGKFNSIAVDVDGNPHISYFNEREDDLKYIHWNGEKWVKRTIDDHERVGLYTSIAIRGGKPRISYYDISNRSIKYASFSGSSWSLKTVYRSGTAGMYSSIALDSNDNPHISYYYLARDELRYASWTGSEWSTMVVDSYGDTGKHSSLAIDSNDVPHISYFFDKTDEEGLELKYAVWNGSQWTIETVDTFKGVGQYTSLALDSQNQPHISYYDIEFGRLKYAYKDASGWHSGNYVDTIQGAGKYTSIALDRDDRPHISYFVESLDRVKYTRWLGTTWEPFIVDNTDQDIHTGTYTSLALDKDDNPSISYYHFDEGDLKYAWWNGGGFNTTILDGEDEDENVGRYSSLALDSSDFPNIAYYDEANRDLLFTYWTGTAWEYSVVDYDESVGEYTSLALDRNGNPHISYFDATNEALKYAYVDRNENGTPWPLYLIFVPMAER
jgi:hypothetical protein